MGPDPKILDDIARVADGAANIVSGMGQQIQEEIQARVDHMAARMDLVPREDFDDAMALITQLRQSIDELDTRLSKIESPKKKTTKKAKTVKGKKK